MKCWKNLREPRDLQLPVADFAPRNECVKNLFYDVERCEVLNLRRYAGQLKREGGSHVLRKARIRGRKQSTGIGLSVDDPESVTDDFKE